MTIINPHEEYCLKKAYNKIYGKEPKNLKEIIDWIIKLQSDDRCKK